MFTLKLYTGWEQKAEEKCWDKGSKKDKWVNKISKQKIKKINKLIATCSVQEDTDDYMIYTCDDKRYW